MSKLSRMVDGALEQGESVAEVILLILFMLSVVPFFYYAEKNCWGPFGFKSCQDKQEIKAAKP